MKQKHKQTADRRPGQLEDNKRIPDDEFQNKVSEMIREIISKDGTFVTIKGKDNKSPLKSLNTDISHAVQKLTKEETISRITVVVEKGETDAPITASTKKRGRGATQTKQSKSTSDTDKIKDINTKTDVAKENTPLTNLSPLLEKRYGSSSSESIMSVLKQSVLRVDINRRTKGEVSKDKREWMRVCKHSGTKNGVYEMECEIIKRRYRGTILACLGSVACATAVNMAQAEKRQLPDVQHVQASTVLEPQKLNKLEEMVYKALLTRDENCGIVNLEDRVSVFVMTVACTYAKLYFNIRNIVVTPVVLDIEKYIDDKGNIAERNVPDNKKKKTGTIKGVNWTLNKEGKKRLAMMSMGDISSKPLKGSMLDFANAALSLGILGVVPWCLTSISNKKELDRLLNSSTSSNPKKLANKKVDVNDDDHEEDRDQSRSHKKKMRRTSPQGQSEKVYSGEEEEEQQEEDDDDDREDDDDKTELSDAADKEAEEEQEEIVSEGF